MERNEILKQVNEIFIDVLDKDTIVLNDNTTANDIEEWDSLAHIRLVVTIEKKFNAHFSSKEIQSWDNVGEMIDCICEKVK
ncbi:MAG: acyl carrier protein [Bacteroidales bacterium]|jgi:acyl carrier protein|nr:acyl carrier protein [Bacteroidales bacterium]MDD4215101.1 acyl carrier protein [Bacteroidales bacterium]